MTGRGLSTAGVLELLQQTAEDVIRPRWRALTHEDVSEKNPGDFVTVADHESEQVITAALRRAWPGALIVGEEATARAPELIAAVPEAEHAFVVDPIDGTRNFIHGSKHYAVMVGELRSGDIVRGWIWQPELDTAWIAERGSGATRNGATVTLPTPDLSALVGATTHRRLLRHHPPAVAEIGWTLYACGIDYPNLCLGVGDFLIYRNMKPWDHVPGSLILREAGGVSRTIDGRNYRASRGSVPLVVAVNDDVWRVARSCLA